MENRILGKTGIEVSEIAFGGVEIGIPYGLAASIDMISEKDAINLLNAAYEKGINFFDTARMYGVSESLMGKAFVDKRKDIVIASKCFHLRDLKRNLPNNEDLESIIRASLNDSLNALKTDYLDVFMLHQADIEILSNEAIADVFVKIKDEGRVRAIGVSTYTLEESFAALDAKVWDMIQLPFNLMDQRQSSVFDYANKLGVGIVVRSVLLKGLLSGRGERLHSSLKVVEEHIQSYNSLLSKDIDNLPAFATKFALSFKNVTSVLIGIDKLDYLYKSIESANGGFLDPQTLKLAIDSAFPNPEFINLPHWDAMGWLN